MTRQRHRPTAGSGKAEVISIGARGTRHPDYSRLACAQISAARQKLSLDHAGFADLIGGMLGWDVMPETVAAWEDDVTPTGDVLLACTAAAGTALGDAPYAAPILAGVPPSFDPEELAGHWVTCYQFTHAGQPQYHADIAHVTVGPGNHIRAVNHPPEPRSEGRQRAFRNEIDAALAGRHLIGEWRNTSDTRYYGTLQLAVLPGEIVMEGWYSGVGSDIEVSASFWKWVRLDPGPVPAPAVTLRDPHDLYDLVMSHSQYGTPLLLADVRGEP